MNRKNALFAAAAIAATFGFLYALRPDEPVAKADRTRAAVETFTPPEALLDLDANVAAANARRNLFTYRELPRIPRPVIQVASLKPLVVPQPVVIEAPRPEPQPVAPPLPTFPHAYLGRFGPAGNPIAVFRIDGDVVNARAGETIAGAYIVRKVGADDVEIGFPGSEHVVRVPLRSEL